MLGLGLRELFVLAVVLSMMLAGVGAIVFVVMKLAGSSSSKEGRRIAELEQQVAELQRNQNRNTGN